MEARYKICDFQILIHVLELIGYDQQPTLGGGLSRGLSSTLLLVDI